jgi:hypothetical protein
MDKDCASKERAGFAVGQAKGPLSFGRAVGEQYLRRVNPKEECMVQPGREKGPNFREKPSTGAWRALRVSKTGGTWPSYWCNAVREALFRNFPASGSINQERTQRFCAQVAGSTMIPSYALNPVPQGLCSLVTLYPGPRSQRQEMSSNRSRSDLVRGTASDPLILGSCCSTFMEPPLQPMNMSRAESLSGQAGRMGLS